MVTGQARCVVYDLFKRTAQQFIQLVLRDWIGRWFLFSSRMKGEERPFASLNSFQPFLGRLCHPPSAIRSDLHSIKSDRALIKPSNLPMAMRKKGKKVHADYDNFLLGCDDQKNGKN
jgi:hypothetical protein